MVYIRRTHVILFTARLPLFYRRRDPHLRQAARRDQAHSQKHDAKKDFEREKEEKRRFDDELSYFFCKFAKETETDQETPAPCIRRHTKGRLQDTHCKDVGVTRDTLPPQPTLEALESGVSLHKTLSELTLTVTELCMIETILAKALA